jgi:arsenate reductase-like glutaredoxin family protein
MRRVVDLYTVPGDRHCEEIRDFLEKQDIKLVIRDVTNKPLSYEEIAKLIRHLDLKHFVNTESKLYSLKKLHQELPDRSELFEMMADDNDLLVKPIVVAGRLMVVGPNRPKIIEMLQLKSNGSGEGEDADKRIPMSTVRTRPSRTTVEKPAEEKVE